jgi:hypothetical protein
VSKNKRHFHVNRYALPFFGKRRSDTVKTAVWVALASRGVIFVACDLLVNRYDTVSGSDSARAPGGTNDNPPDDPSGSGGIPITGISLDKSRLAIFPRGDAHYADLVLTATLLPGNTTGAASDNDTGVLTIAAAAGGVAATCETAVMGRIGEDNP